MAKSTGKGARNAWRAFGLVLCVVIGVIPWGVAAPTAKTRPAPITLAAVGDSITTWHGFTPVGRTWAMDLDHGAVQVDYSAGWAQSGAFLSDMANGVRPVTDDYLVVMGGVNDIAHADVTPMASRLASLESIVLESSLPPDRVVICAIAPLSPVPGLVAQWNSQEKQLAARFGWHYVDPWTSVRSPAGTYRAQYTVEGLHPNSKGSLLVADSIARAIRRIDGARTAKG